MGSGVGTDTDGTSSSAQDAADKLEKLIKKHKLNTEEYEDLLLAFEILLKKNCMFETLANQLISNGSKFEVEIGPTEDIAPAQYESSSNKIVFKDPSQINSYNLGEEITHFHQDEYAYYGGTGNYSVGNGRANIEYEAKLFGDISLQLHKIKYPNDDYFSCCKVWLNGNDHNDYYFWIQDLVGDGNHPSCWEVSQRYNEFLGKFSSENPEYGSPLYSMQPNSLLNGLNFCN